MQAEVIERWQAREQIGTLTADSSRLKAFGTTMRRLKRFGTTSI